MALYQINKGIGKPVEFKGLQAQYLMIFAGGLLGVLILFFLLYMAGVKQWVSIGICLLVATVVVWATFWLNGKFGRYGLMKLYARSRHPRRISSDIPFERLLKHPADEK